MCVVHLPNRFTRSKPLDVSVTSNSSDIAGFSVTVATAASAPVAQATCVLVAHRGCVCGRHNTDANVLATTVGPRFSFRLLREARSIEVNATVRILASASVLAVRTAVYFTLRALPAFRAG